MEPYNHKEYKEKKWCFLCTNVMLVKRLFCHRRKPETILEQMNYEEKIIFVMLTCYVDIFFKYIVDLLIKIHFEKIGLE